MAPAFDMAGPVEYVLFHVDGDSGDLTTVPRRPGTATGTAVDASFDRARGFLESRGVAVSVQVVHGRRPASAIVELARNTGRTGRRDAPLPGPYPSPGAAAGVGAPVTHPTGASGGVSVECRGAPSGTPTGGPLRPGDPRRGRHAVSGPAWLGTMALLVCAGLLLYLFVFRRSRGAGD